MNTANVSFQLKVLAATQEIQERAHSNNAQLNSNIQ